MGEEKERVILLGSEGCGTGDADLGVATLGEILDLILHNDVVSL